MAPRRRRAGCRDDLALTRHAIAASCGICASASAAAARASAAGVAVAVIGTQAWRHIVARLDEYRWTTSEHARSAASRLIAALGEEEAAAYVAYVRRRSRSAGDSMALIERRANHASGPSDFPP